MALDAKLHTDGYFEADLQSLKILVENLKMHNMQNMQTPKTHLRCKNKYLVT